LASRPENWSGAARVSAARALAHDAAMTTTPINLNKARKARAKEEAKAKAAENRARSGRTKAEKAAEAARTAKIQSLLDGAKRER
jgi:hypothetical protein